MSLTNRNSLSSKLFDGFNNIIMIILALSTLYPFWFLFVLSVSPDSYNMTGFRLLPEGFALDSYIKVFQDGSILSGYVMTISRTVLGTVLTIVFSLFAAYPLSKKYFPHRGFWTTFIVFTMFFSGGLIPNYLLMKKLNMFNTIWSLVLPGLISTYNMLIMRNYLMSLPESLEESAKIDGANEFIILFSIILPISKPIIATVSLWTAVGHWNAWFDSMIYFTDAKKHVVQLVLRRIVLQGSSRFLDINMSAEELMQTASPESLKAAATMFVTLPILVVYPFLQKYFVKGIMIGSLKG